MHPIVSRLLFLPTFAWNALLGRVLHQRRWWDRIEQHLILGAMPLKRDIPELVAEGVTGVVNMCQEYPGPLHLYSEHGIEQIWLPTVDFNPPTLEQIIQGVDFIHRKIDANETVYVHCKAGRARSATVVLCFLMAHRGMSADQAQALLLQCRPHVFPRLPDREVVKEFAKRIVKN